MAHISPDTYIPLGMCKICLRFFLLTLSCIGCCEHIGAQTYLRYPFERVIKKGDSIQWVNPAYDHSSWDRSGRINTLGNYWVRFRVKCDTITDTFRHTGMQIISTGSYEVYWDSVQIGKNGVVGKNRATEVPGQFITQLLVPDSLLSHGVHNVAFRVSNYHFPNWGFPTWNQFYLEEYLSSQQRDLSISGFFFILAGVYLMASLYYLLIFFLRKPERVTLIFSLICFLFFSLLLMEYAKFYYLYPYHWHPIRLGIILILHLCIAFLMPLFFLWYFQIPFRKLLNAAILLTYLTICSIHMFNMDLINQILGEWMWGISLIIVGYAVYRRKNESKVMLGAVILAGIIVKFFPGAYSSMLHAYDITLFIGFSILVFAMMYLLAQRAQKQQLAYEASLTLSTRLQNELLKKNIQPHFIMNTLTSLMEWIEESPEESVNFIEALAGEFEIMRAISEKKLIPLEQELALCQQHITLMRFRKEIAYEFSWGEIPPGRKVPPAIFHTLIENAITHSMPGPDGKIRMHLELINEEGYELSVFAKNRKQVPSEDGTGLKYIRSRLTENFGEDWKLISESTEFGWRTCIWTKKISV